MYYIDSPLLLWLTVYIFISRVRLLPNTQEYLYNHGPRSMITYPPFFYRLDSVINDDFDDILTNIAKNLYIDSDIDNLGKKLGVRIAAINLYIKRNNQPGEMYMGTLEMLRDWRKGQKRSQERQVLSSALVAAGLIRMNEDYFGTSTTAMDSQETEDALRLVSQPLRPAAEAAGPLKIMGSTSEAVGPSGKVSGAGGSAPGPARPAPEAEKYVGPVPEATWQVTEQDIRAAGTSTTAMDYQGI
nr:uncharacterized protein LOC129267939 [Lytechinus pictus]